jgi:hypothetical protein
MAVQQKIKSFTTFIGNKISFLFADGTTATAVYDPVTGAKVSGSGNAPNIFSLKNAAKAVKFTVSAVKNLQSLLPSNFVSGNKTIAGYKEKIIKAITFNKLDIIISVKNKIKDILGIFNAGSAVVSQLPKLFNLPGVSLSDLATKASAQLKTARESITNLVKNSINGVKTSIQNTSNLGDLAVSKYKEVDNLAINNPLEKKELAQSLIKQKQVEDTIVEQSSISLQEKVIKKVEIFTQPVETSQNIVSTITQVD